LVLVVNNAHLFLLVLFNDKKTCRLQGKLKNQETRMLPIAVELDSVVMHSAMFCECESQTDRCLAYHTVHNAQC